MLDPPINIILRFRPLSTFPLKTAEHKYPKYRKLLFSLTNASLFPLFLWISEKSKPITGSGTIPGSENTEHEWAYRRRNIIKLNKMACKGPQRLKNKKNEDLFYTYSNLNLEGSPPAGKHHSINNYSRSYFRKLWGETWKLF